MRGRRRWNELLSLGAAGMHAARRWRQMQWRTAHGKVLRTDGAGYRRVTLQSYHLAANRPRGSCLSLSLAASACPRAGEAAAVSLLITDLRGHATGTWAFGFSRPCQSRGGTYERPLVEHQPRRCQPPCSACARASHLPLNLFHLNFVCQEYGLR